MDQPKIDARTRSLTPRDQELISAIRTKASQTGSFTLSEVALGFLARDSEAIKITMAIRKANGGVRFRSATLKNSDSTEEILTKVNKYLRARSPMDPKNAEIKALPPPSVTPKSEVIVSDAYAESD